MFVLFLRLLAWKRYADRHYWRRRPPLHVEGVRELARRVGRDLPFFSIFIPARNEAGVIERTVDHMARLDYPPDRYEVIVITDQKETEAANQKRSRVVPEAARFLRAVLTAPARPGPVPPDGGTGGAHEGPDGRGGARGGEARGGRKVITLPLPAPQAGSTPGVAGPAGGENAPGTLVAAAHALSTAVARWTTHGATATATALAAAPVHVPSQRNWQGVLAEADAAPDASEAPLVLRPYVTPSPEAEGLVLGLLAQLASEGGDEIRRRYLPETNLGALRDLTPAVVHALVWEAAQSLWLRRGRPAGPGVEELLRHRSPGASEEEILSAHAALLGRAIPAVVALAQLRGDPHRRRLVYRMAAHAARANHTLTQEILLRMSEALAADILARLARLLSGPDRQLEHKLEETYRIIYPTTQDILQRKMAEFSRRRNVPKLRHVDVPVDFDGNLGGKCLGYPVPSTKGRALNWGLGFVDPRTEWCGFYDAESRPDPRVMLYVARRWLEDLAAHRHTGGGSPGCGWRAPRVELPVRIFQGPVFQVRNFHEMGAFCKIASLYQAIAHDWYLPSLFRRLPFVGGTNLFVDRRLLEEIGGYDAQTLTEDLELGTRAYVRAGAWPEYLPLASSEQTPPTFRGFFRQRLRWATGHLQVMSKLKREAGPNDSRRRELVRELLRKGQFEWVFYQSATLVPPLATALYWMGWLDPKVLWGPARSALNLLSLVYIVFTIYAYFRYQPYVERRGTAPGRLQGQITAVASLLLLPLAAFLFPLPQSSALILSGLGRGPREWVKTPRTRE